MQKKANLKMRKDRIFDDFINTYCNKYTKDTEAPKELHVWTAISIICGALGKKCYMDFQKYRFDTNMFIVLVAPPGIISKSTTLGIGYSLLKKVPGINFGPDSGSWQAFIDSFEESTQTYKIKGQPEMTASCLNFAVGELGTLLRTKDEERMDTIVRLWDSPDAYIKKTRGESIEIEHPWMNMMGATTPSWIEQNLKDYAIGGGFSSRTLFLYADRKAQLIAHPNTAPEDKRKMEVLSAQLVHDLTKISQMNGVFTFDEETLAFAEKWYIEHNDRKKNSLWNEELTSAYAARKQIHLYKVCMAVSAARGDSMVINMSDFKTALRLLNKVEENLSTIFVAVSEDENMNAISHIVNLIRTKGKMPDHAIKHALKHRYTAFVVGRAIDNAVASQQLRFGQDDMQRAYVALPRTRKGKS